MLATQASLDIRVVLRTLKSKYRNYLINKNERRALPIITCFSVRRSILERFYCTVYGHLCQKGILEHRVKIWKANAV